MGDNAGLNSFWFFLNPLSESRNLRLQLATYFCNLSKGNTESATVEDSDW